MQNAGINGGPGVSDFCSPSYVPPAAARGALLEVSFRPSLLSGSFCNRGSVCMLMFCHLLGYSFLACAFSNQIQAFWRCCQCVLCQFPHSTESLFGRLSSSSPIPPSAWDAVTSSRWLLNLPNMALPGLSARHISEYTTNEYMLMTCDCVGEPSPDYRLGIAARIWSSTRSGPYGSSSGGN